MCLQECWLHSLNLFAKLQGSSADGVMRIYMDGCLIGENPGAPVAPVFRNILFALIFAVHGVSIQDILL